MDEDSSPTPLVKTKERHRGLPRLDDRVLRVFILHDIKENVFSKIGYTGVEDERSGKRGGYGRGSCSTGSYSSARVRLTLTCGWLPTGLTMTREVMTSTGFNYVRTSTGLCFPLGRTNSSTRPLELLQ